MPQRALMSLTLDQLNSLTLDELVTMVIDPSDIDARVFVVAAQQASRLQVSTLGITPIRQTLGSTSVFAVATPAHRQTLGSITTGE